MTVALEGLTWRDQIPVARQIIRDGISIDEFLDLPQSLQDAVCDEFRVEAALVKSLGTCSGNCTSQCLRRDHRGETVCKWTNAPCPNQPIQRVLKLFSLLNVRSNLWQAQQQPQ